MIPRQLRYSEALKPVSVPSSQQTRRFLPISSGTYTVSNNIIRIPINSNAFLDLKNMVLKFNLKQTANVSTYLDGSASSIIQRLELIGPDGQNLSTVDAYNRLYHAMVDVERSVDNREGFGNLMEGSSGDNIKIALRSNATANVIEVWINDTLIRTLTTGVANSCRAGEFLFETTATANEFKITGAVAGTATGGGAVAGNTGTVTLGTAGAVRVNGVEFRTTATAGLLAVDGSNILTGTPSQVMVQHDPRIHYAVNQSEIFVQNTEKRYCIPIMCPITRIPTLFPANLVGGGGVMLQITLPNTDDQVFFSAHKTTSPVFEVSSVELIIPVLNYPDSVVSSLRGALQQLGSLNMSSVDFQTFIYPYTTSANMSIPIAIRARSLKAIYFFFQSNQSSSDYTVPRVSARERLGISDFQLRVGSQYFPASKVVMTSTEVNEPVVELLKSVSKLNDLRLGSYLNKDNFNVAQAYGGMSVFGLDLESLEENFSESGINTADNALQTFLDITCSAPATAGNCYIYCLYDSTLSILSNGNMVSTR